MSSDLVVPLYLSYGALWILVIVQGVVLLGVVRIVSQLQKRGAAANPGMRGEAPAFTAVDLSGRRIATKDLAGRMTALLFASPHCEACTDSLADVEYLRREGHANVIVICQSGREDCAKFAEEHRIGAPVIADADNRVSDLYNASAVPMIYLIDADNQIQAYGRLPRARLEA